MKALTTGALCVAFGLAGTGCSRDGSESPRTSANLREGAEPAFQPASRTMTRDPSEPATSVPHAIAEARCSVEGRCRNIGASKKYASIETCLKQVKDEWRDEIADRACPSGTERVALERCIGEIRAEDCAAMSTGLDGVRTCSFDELCHPALE